VIVNGLLQALLRVMGAVRPHALDAPGRARRLLTVNKGGAAENLSTFY
jgi:hypothetical protein